ncbi:MAG: hypothetical protein IJT94_05320 [Oscillibacter sp.]|nr:hypothetical protein [Oscillibacter sp.]
MNVTNTARVPQYEVERSIRAVKAAAEQNDRQGQTAAVQAAQTAQRVERPEAVQAAAAKNTDAVGTVDARRAPQVDAYIPKSPRAPIEAEEKGTPAANQAARPAAGHAEGAVSSQAADPADLRENAAANRPADAAAAPDTAAPAAFADRAADASQLDTEGAAVYGEADGAETVQAFSLQDAEEEEEEETAVSANQDRTTATYNTDKVDQEVRNLKTQLEQVQRRARGERDIQTAEKLESQAVQLRRELLWKSTDAYRRQAAVMG